MQKYNNNLNNINLSRNYMRKWFFYNIIFVNIFVKLKLLKYFIIRHIFLNNMIYFLLINLEHFNLRRIDNCTLQIRKIVKFFNSLILISNFL